MNRKLHRNYVIFTLWSDFGYQSFLFAVIDKHLRFLFMFVFAMLI